MFGGENGVRLLSTEAEAEKENVTMVFFWNKIQKGHDWTR